MQNPSRHPQSITASLSGELDHNTAPAIRSQLDSLLRDPNVIHLTLDLQNLTFMDSSGVGVLLGRLRELQSRGGSMSVRHLSPTLHKLFVLTGMQRVIHIEGGKS